MSALYACLAGGVDCVDVRDAGMCCVRLRHESDGAICETSACVCRKGRPEQNHSWLKQRHRRGATAEAYARVLWLLRLALVCARTLVARKTASNVSKRIFCQGGARCASKKSCS